MLVRGMPISRDASAERVLEATTCARAPRDFREIARTAQSSAAMSAPVVVTGVLIKKKTVQKARAVAARAGGIAASWRTQPADCASLATLQKVVKKSFSVDCSKPVRRERSVAARAQVSGFWIKAPALAPPVTRCWRRWRCTAAHSRHVELGAVWPPFSGPARRRAASKQP